MRYQFSCQKRARNGLKIANSLCCAFHYESEFILFQADSENLISMAAAFHAMEQSRLSSNESSTLDLTAMLLDEQVPLTISKNESGFKIQFEDKEMNLKGIVYSSFSNYFCNKF